MKIQKKNSGGGGGVGEGLVGCDCICGQRIEVFVKIKKKFFFFFFFWGGGGGGGWVGGLVGLGAGGGGSGWM